MTNSRAKGAVGEREAAQFLTQLFDVPVRRGCQFRGGPDSPDVIGLDGLHIEVKRRERISVDKSLEQAKRDAGPDITPALLHRSNRTRWKLTFYAEDVHRLVEAINRLVKAEARKNVS